VDRKALLVACDLVRAALALGVAGAAFQGLLTVPAALALSAALAATSAFFAPAAMALVPALVPPDRVLRATSLMEASVQGAAIAGPALGGAIVAAAGVAGAFGLNGLTFLASAALLLLVAFPPHAAGAAAEPFVRAMGGGFRLLRADPTVAGVLACFAAVNVFTMPVILFLPYFAKDVFRVGATGLGWMEAALGLGMLGAALFWAARSRTRPFPVVAGGIAGVAAAVAAMGLMPAYGVHLAALAAAGLAMGSVNVVVVAWFQGRVPPTEAGRFFGLLTSVCSGLVPLSFGAYGLLAGRFDPAWLLAANAGAIAAIAVALAFVPGFRRA
jgi:predicted MFS family arabinose efflux permease